MKIKTNDSETNYIVEGLGPSRAMAHALARNLSMRASLEFRRAA